jgi:hypothetical protein
MLWKALFDLDNIAHPWKELRPRNDTIKKIIFTVTVTIMKQGCNNRIMHIGIPIGTIRYVDDASIIDDDVLIAMKRTITTNEYSRT